MGETGETGIFSMERLLNYTAEDHDLAHQVVEVFLTDTPDQLASLQYALDCGDAKTAERVAHSLKGASATVGAELLRQTAFECECLGRQADLEALRPKVPELTRQFTLLREAMAKAGFIVE